MAYAITLDPQTIGLWGIDPQGNYKPQRSEVQHFIQIARDRGIEVIAPEDKILEPHPFYGIEADHGRWIDGMSRRVRDDIGHFATKTEFRMQPRYGAKRSA